MDVGLEGDGRKVCGLYGCWFAGRWEEIVWIVWMLVCREMGGNCVNCMDVGLQGDGRKGVSRSGEGEGRGTEAV